MEFMKAGEKELEVLFWAFEIKYPVKCEYCDEMVSPNNCGGFCPNFEKNNFKPIILCKSPLCMTTYLTNNEEAIKLDKLKEAQR
jgi:hypothetical protein